MFLGRLSTPIARDSIYKQCRPLVDEPRLVAIVINLLGDKDDKLVAGQIHKLLNQAVRLRRHVVPSFNLAKVLSQVPVFWVLCSPLASEAVKAGAHAPYGANAQEETIKMYWLCIIPFNFVLSLACLSCCCCFFFPA